MLNRLEVHHVISNDVTKVYHFNLLFGILDIPSELGAKVKASPSRLRVFPSADEAVDESFFGDRLDRFCFLFETNRPEACERLKAGRFPFNDDSSMVVFFLRVDDPPEENLKDPIGSEVINSSCGGAHKVKQRNRETKLVLSIVEQATVFVWYSSSYQQASCWIRGRDISEQHNDQTRMGGPPPSVYFEEHSVAFRCKT